jgi:hypothetical protein
MTGQTAVFRKQARGQDVEIAVTEGLRLLCMAPSIAVPLARLPGTPASARR